MMLYLASVLALMQFLPLGRTFVVDVQNARCATPLHSMTSRPGDDSWMLPRRQLFQVASGAVLLTPITSLADVSDGNTLPQAANQFARVIRLRNDLKTIRKRVADNASDIDKKEWDNIGKFLRVIYTTGEDMKAVASGIANPDNKSRALEDITQLRKYAQAGDVSVSKQDGRGFLAVADKMTGLVDDFFDSLSDVPDEL